MKKILILYTNYGTGHYMAAKAINEYIKDNYLDCEVRLLDPLTYSRPLINKLFAKIGNVVATRFRKFRGELYKNEMYKNYLKSSWFYTLCIKIFWTKKLESKLLEFNPDIIISTQVGPTGLIAVYKHLFNAKLVSVFTDYGIHRMYTVAHKFIDIYCVPSNEIRDKMVDIGIESDKIKVTGIPVRAQFMVRDNTFREKLINEYNLLKNKPLFLFVCGGGLGYDNAFIYFEKLLQSDYEFSYIFVSGKNNKLSLKAEKLACKYKKCGKVLGYVQDIDRFIKSSDIVFGKPGGVVTSETLNLGVPLCAIAPIPGQETNNALFISNNKFGFYIKSIKEFQVFLDKLGKKKINLEEYKKNINNNFEKFSFEDIL